jgi:hypothetical protein
VLFIRGGRPDVQDFEEPLRESYDDKEWRRRADRALPLRRGTFLILREVGAPAAPSETRLGGSLGFPEDFGKETAHNEAPFFF